MKPSHFATILDDAFVLPARDLPVAALTLVAAPTAALGLCGEASFTAPQSVTRC
ncbi:MAG: hypothetical protein ACR2L2_08725 [Acidobacteriota bacterium]